MLSFDSHQKPPSERISRVEGTHQPTESAVGSGGQLSPFEPDHSYDRVNTTFDVDAWHDNTSTEAKCQWRSQHEYRRVSHPVCENRQIQCERHGIIRNGGILVQEVQTGGCREGRLPEILHLTTKRDNGLVKKQH